MNKTEEIKRVPVAPLPGPAGLEGVLIDACAFTETVAQKMPRPPLRAVQYKDGRPTGDVTLMLSNGYVYVRIEDWHTCDTFGELSVYDRLYPYRDAGQPKNPSYTGEITPAMWARIRKWWNP